MSIMTGTIASPTGQPREGVQLDFLASDGTIVSAITDAAGAYRVALPEGTTYRLGLVSAFRLNGSAYRYPAGTVFAVSVPEGYGPPAMTDAAPGGLTAMLARIEALEAAVAARQPAPAGEGV